MTCSKAPVNGAKMEQKPLAIIEMYFLPSPRSRGPPAGWPDATTFWDYPSAVYPKTLWIACKAYCGWPQTIDGASSWNCSIGNTTEAFENWEIAPIFGGGTSLSLQSVEGYTFQPGQIRTVYINWVAPRYFETLGTPLLAGRCAFSAKGLPIAPLRPWGFTIEAR